MCLILATSTSTAPCECVPIIFRTSLEYVNIFVGVSLKLVNSLVGGKPALGISVSCSLVHFKISVACVLSSALFTLLLSRVIQDKLTAYVQAFSSCLGQKKKKLL